MKRALMTATAALALAATPAVAQVSGDTEFETDAAVETDVPDVNIESEADAKSDVETDVETDADEGTGGEFYENEADAAADADLDAETDIEMERNEDMRTEGDADADVEIETEADAKPEDGQGGPYAEDRADAADRLSDLGAMTDGEVSADVDGLDTSGLNDYVLGQIDKADTEAGLETDADAEGETTY